jgi:hypothetical protein
MPSSAATASSAASFSTHGDEVLLLDRADVIQRELHEGLRAARSPHEFHLYAVGSPSVPTVRSK